MRPALPPELLLEWSPALSTHLDHEAVQDESKVGPPPLPPVWREAVARVHPEYAQGELLQPHQVLSALEEPGKLLPQRNVAHQRLACLLLVRPKQGQVQAQ